MPKEQPFAPSDDLDQFEGAPEEVEEVEESQEPRYVTIRLNGKTLEVTEDVADAIHAREADYQRQISKMGTELGTLRRQPQDAPRPSQDDSPDEDLQWFQSPSKAQRAREERLKAELRQELAQEIALQEARSKWWGRFYSAHPDLADKQRMIAFVVQEYGQEIGQIQDEGAAHRALARYARELMGQSSEGKPLRQRQVETERSSNAPPSTRSAPKAQQGPQTISDVLRMNAEEMRRRRLKLAKEDK